MFTSRHVAKMASSISSSTESDDPEGSGYCAGDSETLEESDQDRLRRASSVLEKLRSPTQSDICRKRRVATNPAHSRSKRPRAARGISNPASVTPAHRVKEFPNEQLKVSSGKIFCSACREELSTKKSTIENHIASAKHCGGKKKLASKELREKDIADAFKLYDVETHPSGETLPEDVRIYRVKVLSTFLKAGVPINKIAAFRDILEENSLRLAGRKPMSDLIPFVLHTEKKQIKSELANKPISVVFDGTTRLGEALALIVRYVEPADFNIQQRLVRLQIVTKSMTGEQIAREILSILSTEYGVLSNHLLAAMHDRASTNNVAMRSIRILYPAVLDIGCYSHTIDHVGEKFVTPTLHEFGLLWVSLFAHSPKACVAWRTRTGRSMASYSKTRWWSRWEVFQQVMLQYGDLVPFLEENADIAPSTRPKLLSLLCDPQKNTKLQLELASIIDCGEAFVKATYSLEGDGALVFSCFDVLSSLQLRIQNAHFPNLIAVAKKLGGGDHTTRTKQLIQYGMSCVSPGLEYYGTKFSEDLAESVAAFKAARLFVPQKVLDLKPDAAAVDTLASFPFLNTRVLNDLKSELPDYLAKADDVAMDVTTTDWWKRHQADLPHWSRAAQLVALVQPSSAAAERVFSLLQNSFSSRQDNSLQDYVESSLMFQYNQR